MSTKGSNLSFRGLMQPEQGMSTGVLSGSKTQTGFQGLEERGARYRGSRVRRKAFGRLWPNGEFSVSWPRREKQESTNLPVRDYGEFRDSSFVLRGCERIALEEGRQKNREARLTLACLWALILTNAIKARKNGMKGCTSYGKKMVRSAAYLLQRKAGRRNLSFLTLTVPPMGLGELREVAMSWGELIRRLIQLLTRRLAKAKLPTEVVSVTELQTGRLKAGSLGCLHVHVVFSGRRNSRSSWFLRPLDIRKWWLKQLSSVVGRAVQSQSCENIQSVKKDASAYLGKYLSKGAGDVERFAAIAGCDCVPGQWWNMSEAARASVKKATRAGEDVGVICEAIVQAYFLGQCPFPGYLACHHIELDGEALLVAYTGRLSRGVLRDVGDWLLSVRASIGA